METLVIEITDQKAYGLLKGMEELKLIKMKNSANGISSLPKKIKSPMSNTDIDNQLNKLRNEWQRDI